MNQYIFLESHMSILSPSTGSLAGVPCSGVIPPAPPPRRSRGGARTSGGWPSCWRCKGWAGPFAWFEYHISTRSEGGKPGPCNPLPFLLIKRPHPSSPLAEFFSGLWCELQPHQITTIGHIGGHQNASAPTASPVSTDAWMFSGVAPARRSAILSRLGTEGLKTSTPSFAVRLSSVPAPNPTSSAKPRGILTTRLFPGF